MPYLERDLNITETPHWVRHGLMAVDFPRDLALLYDADKAPTRELTGKGHAFNYSILSPQYQHNADGSYTNVGANPAIDVFDGEKWLRSCGAVTNIANTDTTFTAGGTTPPIVTNNTSHLGVACHAITFTPSNTSLGYAGCRAAGKVAPVTELLTYTGALSISLSRPLIGDESIVCFVTGLIAFPSVSINAGNSTVYINAYKTIEVLKTMPKGGGWTVFHACFLDKMVSSDLTVYIHSAQLTQTPYPVPYTPPGTTMPASNSTTTNGCWFTLADGSPVWKALTGEPLTLATRVRMGVGSEDLPNSAALSIVSCLYDNSISGAIKSGAGAALVQRAYDGSKYAQNDAAWPRNAIIRRVTQVNTEGTQFRVGYMIEGTHTAIQWSAWVNYDGSFGPSILYRLMLGYNNKYPTWYNKIAVWREEVSDARILEAMA